MPSPLLSQLASSRISPATHKRPPSRSRRTRWSQSPRRSGLRPRRLHGLAGRGSPWRGLVARGGLSLRAASISRGEERRRRLECRPFIVVRAREERWGGSAPLRFEFRAALRRRSFAGALIRPPSQVSSTRLPSGCHSSSGNECSARSADVDHICRRSSSSALPCSGLCSP